MHTNESQFSELEKALPDYTIITQIGAGSTADIFLAKQRTLDLNVAIKVVKIDSDCLRDVVMNEININRKIDHPNIIKYVEYFDLGDLIAIVMEYSPNGDLLTYFNRIYYSQRENAFIQNNPILFKAFSQVAAAIRYLHNEVKVVHRDLKMENVLLNQSFDAKLIDFGLCKKFEDICLMNTRCGSPCYTAPEVIVNKGDMPYNEKADIWSLGVMLYYFSTGELPFNDENIQKLFQKIVTGPLLFNDTAEKNLPDFLKDLITKMLDKNPASRISIDEVLNHPFMKIERIICKPSYSSPFLSTAGGPILGGIQCCKKKLESKAGRFINAHLIVTTSSKNVAISKRPRLVKPRKISGGIVSDI